MGVGRKFTIISFSPAAIKLLTGMTRVEQCGVKMVRRGEEGCSPAQPLWAHLAPGRGCRGLREVTETEGGGRWGNIHPHAEILGPPAHSRT